MTAIPLSRVLADSVWRLPHEFVVTGSDTLWVPGYGRLERGADYSLDARFGSLRFIRLDSSLIQAARRDSTIMLSFRYRYFPFSFARDYYRRTPIIVRDSAGSQKVNVVTPVMPFRMEDVFGPNLQKSGSLVRGFTVGSNRDATLTSGLRLQLAGKLSSEIEIAASLTDENTPIQPEGTTETLQEFDKVFVEIKSPNVGATLGDFNLELGQSEFGSLTRKLQGAQLSGHYRFGDAQAQAMVAGAATRGKYSTLQIQGLEGVQGPYRLVGRNNETAIIVIAGSERVYVNGELQRRGETNDYVIDYGTAEISFTPRRLITAASRLVIDFEYTDRQYARSLFGTRAGGDLPGGAGRLSVSYLREADNPDAPIDFSITDSTRKILEEAGSDRSKAAISGATQVDSNGVYVRVDTVIAGAGRSFFRYAPGDPEAHYVVRFSSVGMGRGEYVRKEFGVFEWRGAGGGDYLPVIFLPFPEEHELVDVQLSVAPARDLTFEGEFARSNFTLNRFSTVEGSEESGNGYSLSMKYTPREMRIAGAELGSLSLSLHERYQAAGFVPFDRANEIEFGRKWGVDSLEEGDERIREITAGYSPFEALLVNGSYGHYSRGGTQSSDRADAGIRLAGPAYPDVNYTYELIRSTDTRLAQASRWMRHRGSASDTWWKLRPFIRYEGEDRLQTAGEAGQVLPGSFRFQSLAGGITAHDLGRITVGAEFGWRNDENFDGTGVSPESRSVTQSYQARLNDWEDLSSSFDLTFRKREFSPTARSRGNEDIQTVLMRARARYAPLRRAVDLDVHYEVLTQRSANIQRVFILVARGSGNYRYLGDLNSNSIADDYEFVQARFDGDYVARYLAVGELVPIIDLKTGARLRLQPQRIFERGTSLVTDVLSALTSETSVRLDEESTTPRLQDIYLLHLSSFQSDSTTIAGASTFLQDILLFDGQPGISGRVRYQQRKGFARLVQGPERLYNRERSIRIRFQPLAEIAGQVEATNSLDCVTGQSYSPRVRDILSNSVSVDFSYRPLQEIEWGMKVEAGRSTDRSPQVPDIADLNTQSARFVYSFAGRGQLRTEASREEVLVKGGEGELPYELTGGRVPGKTWLWSLTFDYRVTGFLQTNVTYDGRSEGGAVPVHTARAEVRAFF